MESVGAAVLIRGRLSSSSRIVPVAEPVEIVAFTGLLSETTIVSFDSGSSSPVAETKIFRLNSPASKTRVPAVSAA